MNNINFEKDRIDSVTQIDSTKTLSDEVIKLRNLEEQIAASEDHTKTLKENSQKLKDSVTYIFADDFGHHFKIALLVGIIKQRYFHVYGHDPHIIQMKNTWAGITVAVR